MLKLEYFVPNDSKKWKEANRTVPFHVGKR